MDTDDWDSQIFYAYLQIFHSFIIGSKLNLDTIEKAAIGGIPMSNSLESYVILFQVIPIV